MTKQIRDAIPEIQLACIAAEVTVNAKNNDLWNIIEEEVNAIHKKNEVKAIADYQIVVQTRKAYKLVGKDPARYRPSADALLRRIIQGKGLYQVNNVVDLLNLVSIKTGFSIGGYDSDKIVGEIKLDCGKNNEAYQGIGRGDLNIEFLPVFRDTISAFGSPTSDSIRTMTSIDTKKFLMIFFNFEKNNQILSAIEYAKTLLLQFANAKNIEVYVID